MVEYDLLALINLMNNRGFNKSIDKLIKISGIFEPPPAMLKAVFEWMRERYCAHILYQVGQFLKEPGIWEFANPEPPFGELSFHAAEDPLIIENNLLKKECLKYTNESWSGRKAAKKFNIDISGWKYIKNIEQSVWYSEIIVELNIGSNHKYGGWWDESKRLLVINAYEETNDLAFSLDEMYRTLYHELQHVGQSYMHLNLNKKPFGAGLPSSHLRNNGTGGLEGIVHSMNEIRKDTRLSKEEKNKRLILLRKKFEKLTKLPMDKTDESGRLHHSLRDEEFYTNLKEDIERFKEVLIKVPAKYRMGIIKLHIDPSYALPNDFPTVIWEYAHQWATSAFFNVLLKYEPKKYRKAVAELFKELQGELGIY